MNWINQSVFLDWELGSLPEINILFGFLLLTSWQGWGPVVIKAFRAMTQVFIATHAWRVANAVIFLAVVLLAIAALALWICEILLLFQPSLNSLFSFIVFTAVAGTDSGVASNATLAAHAVKLPTPTTFTVASLSLHVTLRTTWARPQFRMQRRERLHIGLGLLSITIELLDRNWDKHLDFAFEFVKLALSHYTSGLDRGENWAWVSLFFHLLSFAGLRVHLTQLFNCLVSHLGFLHWRRGLGSFPLGWYDRLSLLRFQFWWFGKQSQLAGTIVIDQLKGRLFMLHLLFPAATVARRLQLFGVLTVHFVVCSGASHCLHLQIRPVDHTLSELGVWGHLAALSWTAFVWRAQTAQLTRQTTDLILDFAFENFTLFHISVRCDSLGMIHGLMEVFKKNR